MSNSDSAPLVCVGGLLCCGIVILIVGGIGYPIAKHSNGNFEATQCNITEYLGLATKECTYCDEFESCSWVNEPCNCDDDGCSTCSRYRCTTTCHYIDYTCSAARWKFSFQTNQDISPKCPKTSTTILRGDFKTASGTNPERMTSVSRDRALQDQRTKKIGSLYNCYYHVDKCNQIKWNLYNVKAWFITLILGASIIGVILFIVLVVYLYIYIVDVINRNKHIRSSSLNKSSINHKSITPKLNNINIINLVETDIEAPPPYKSTKEIIPSAPPPDF